MFAFFVTSSFLTLIGQYIFNILTSIFRGYSNFVLVLLFSRALENTLRLMNGRNETYRKSFNKVDEMSEEFDEKQRLEDQMRAVMDKYKIQTATNS